MTKSTTYLILSTVIVMALTACSSDNSDNSNTDQSTNNPASSGIITGFGSIFVNGVEFETDSAIIDVDGIPGTQDDLAIGMKVDVEGVIHEDGISGEATSVSFDEEIQGPVADIDVGDGINRTFTVLGTTVIIDATTTRFDDDDGNFTFDTIENNDNVEISGFFDEAGVLLATRVELEDADFDANSIVEVEGNISDLSGTTFMLGSIIVDASSAELDDLPNGLVNDIKVEAKGTYDISLNTLNATKVEGEDDELHDSESEIEIEGVVTRYVSDSDFDVDGHAVDASNAEREPSSLEIKLGLHIEVEGSVVNGILIATEAKTRNGNDEVAALVKSVGTGDATNTFVLEPVTGQNITVRVTTTTKLEDKVSDNKMFSFTDIQAGHFIKAKGHINDAGELEARSIKRKDAMDEDVTIKSIISDFDTVSITTTVTVLGVDFPYDGSTEFEKDDVTPYTSTDFFNESSVINGTAKIKVKDEDKDGVADEIEIED